MKGEEREEREWERDRQKHTDQLMGGREKSNRPPKSDDCPSFIRGINCCGE